MLSFSKLISKSGCLHLRVFTSGLLQQSWLARAGEPSFSESQGFSGGKSERAFCFAVAEKCSPGTQPCVIPRGAPCCSCPYPPSAGAAASPQNRGLPCPISGSQTQLSCVAAVPVLCGMHSGQGWDGRLQHETWSGEGREPAVRQPLPFPPAVRCKEALVSDKNNQVSPAPALFGCGVCLVGRVKGESR